MQPNGREMSRTAAGRGEASDVGSIEQLGGRDVAHHDRPERLQREELLGKSALTAQWNLAPIRTDASAASVRPNAMDISHACRILNNSLPQSAKDRHN
jgi:hypothetical protein